MECLIIIVAILFLITTKISFADDKIMYLKCEADPEYMGKPEIIIDRKNQKIFIVPIENGIPLSEDKTSIVGKLVSDNEILFEVSINKFTLRYMLHSLMQPNASYGQCTIQEKKL